jgi:hypothetical protein
MAFAASFRKPNGLVQFLKSHYVAQRIIEDDLGKGEFTGDRYGDLRVLHDNVVAYGRARWTYAATGAKQDPVRALKGSATTVDCHSMAEMFVLLGNELGHGPLRTHQIKPLHPADRIVCKQEVAAFTGKGGDVGIGGRWCFGDHMIAYHEVMHTCFDPTFDKLYFHTSDIEWMYVDWYAEEVQDRNYKAKGYWQPCRTCGFDPPREAKRIYFSTETEEYTFSESGMKWGFFDKCLGKDQHDDVDTSNVDSLRQHFGHLKK